MQEILTQSLTNKRSEDSLWSIIIVPVVRKYFTNPLNYKSKPDVSLLSSFDIIMYTIQVTLPGTLIRNLNLDNLYSSRNGTS